MYRLINHGRWVIRLDLLKYYVGCAGWLHNAWKDEFYPNTIDKEDYLRYYSKVFDFVEIDFDRSNSDTNKNGSYSIPNDKIIQKWSNETLDNFRFTIKLPGSLINQIDKLGDFLEVFAPLEEKILAVVVHQKKLTLANGREWLNGLLEICMYHGYSVALEFDHYSWHQDLTYHILKKYKAVLIWSNKSRHPIVTGDFLYLRIPENERKWINKIKREDEYNKSNRQGDGIKFAVIVVGNPSKVNRVLQLLDLPERKYGDNKWIGKVIMCVDLNAFFPSCEELRDTSLIGNPHAVIMTDQEKGRITKGAVASCSYEARKYGVRSAMSLLKAQELCPNLILNPVDIPYYRQISDKVMRILEEYADVLEQSSIDEAYLDCTNKIRSDPSTTIETYTEQIKKSIKEQCRLLTSIGVANTKSAAKIASDYQKPNGLTIVYPHKLQSFLEPLEVGRIAGVGVKTQHVLKVNFGIETIGQLAKCDVQRLIDEFGKKNGLWMWQVANGLDTDDAVIPREDNISISSEQTLNRHTTDKDKILKCVNELVDEVYERVTGKNYEFRTVGLKLVKSDFSVETREMSYSNYQNAKESIASVVEGLLNKFSFLSSESNNRDDTTLTVRKVGVKLSNLISIEKKKPPQQKTLLDYI
jgi:DNA polymerase IV (archaeal DinB-like DNA polymerase)